jgi:D-Tyr-tRNAtyr deacylase
VNLLGDNIGTIKKNTETLIDTIKEAGLEENAKNAVQNHNIKTVNGSFENVSQFRYFGTTVTGLNLINEEVKRRPISGNVYHHSVQKLLSSRLLSKKLKLEYTKL